MASKTFTGYAVQNPKKWSTFEIVEYPAKNWEETDVEVKITHCGVCGSDVHTITEGWGGIETPMVVGHEIVGEAVKVGSQVEGIKVGDRVGVGAQIGSCSHCKFCKSGNENYCPDGIDTYNAKYSDGVRTQGGYSNGIIAHQQFVFPIPDKVSSENACSMLCAGLTVYSPMVRNGAGPGKKVGVVGIGGLGHYAVLFGKALGAEVFAFTHSPHKEKDIKSLGADHVILTEGDKWHEELAMTFDIIISTRDESDNFPLKEFISMLTMHGKFISVGLPDKPIPFVSAAAFAPNGAFFGSSHIGSKKEALEMLALAAEKNVKPRIEILPMKKCGEAVEGVYHNKVRYRYVLEADI